MPHFEFISAAEFRDSLEADYAEMHRCADSRAWKSVHVLAGSIIEALLVDYLAATNSPPRQGKDPLRLDLAEAIKICTDEGLLTQRSADLSSVIRSYRNLIHPGRTVRLDEEAPSEGSAMIALRLVDIINEQVARRRKEAFGLTAEQLLAKIERDENSLPIFKHLLSESHEIQRHRLLHDLLPERYLELAAEPEADDGDPFSRITMQRWRLEKAFRILFDTSSEEARKRSVERFVRILREEDGDTVRVYREAFVLPRDLAFVAESQRPLVKQHLLSSAPQAHSLRSADYYATLSPFLQERDVSPWLDPYVRAIVAAESGGELRTGVVKAVIIGWESLPAALEPAVDRRIDGWETHFKEKGLDAEAGAVAELRAEIELVRLPF